MRTAADLRSGAFADSLRALDLDLVVNVHSLFVLSDEVLRVPRIGSFNLHPGPLPEYAGLNAPSWAIYEGRAEREVTLHWMDPGIDTAAVAYRASFEIEETDTGLSLTAKCVRHGCRSSLAAGRDRRRVAGSVGDALEQDLSKRRYFGREVPNDGNVDWNAPDV